MMMSGNADHSKYINKYKYIYKYTYTCSYKASQSASLLYLKEKKHMKYNKAFLLPPKDFQNEKKREPEKNLRRTYKEPIMW